MGYVDTNRWHAARCGLAHDYLASAPIVVQRKIWVDGVDIVLSRHSKEHPCCPDQSAFRIMEKFVLDGRLHPKERKTCGVDIDGMAVQTMREPVQRDEFNIVAKSLSIIQDMLDHQPRVDDVAGISVHPRRTAWIGIGVEDAATDSEWLEVFPKHDPFGKDSEPKRVAGSRPKGEKPPGIPRVPNH